mgnify:CR=1 FL=1
MSRRDCFASDCRRILFLSFAACVLRESARSNKQEALATVSLLTWGLEKEKAISRDLG